MSNAAKELAITTYTNPIGVSPGFGGIGGHRNNTWIWVLVIVVILCFNNGDGIFGGGYDCHKKHRRRRRDNIFGENGWFILIVLAALFFLNDGVGGANTNIINVDTEDGPNC